MGRFLKRGSLVVLGAIIAYAIAYSVVVWNKPFEPDYSRLQSAAVRIHYEVKKHSSRQRKAIDGSGIVVSQNRRPDGIWEIDILTNSHVATLDQASIDNGWRVYGPLTVSWWLYPNDPNKTIKEILQAKGVRFLRISQKHDLALLRMESEEPFRNVAQIAKVPAIEGDIVCAVGSPLSLSTVITCGRVSIRSHLFPQFATPNDRYSNEHYIMATVPIWFGNSGGGLFNTKYELVGVAARVTAAAHIAFFVPLQDVIKFLNETE